MRIHTDKIGYTQTVRNALKREQDAGRIAPHVAFKTLQPHRSTVREYAFEIQLTASERDNGRRAGNSGSYGALTSENGYAATFDEWGWLLSALFELDKEILVGGPKNVIYDGKVGFDHLTGLTYNPTELLPQLESGHWPAFVGRDDYDGGDPYPFVRVGSRANSIGRRGYGRDDGTKASRWPSGYKLKPRTPDEYRAFAHIAAGVQA